MSLFELVSHPQHYGWGSTTAIPEFLGREPDGRPWAEAWFGAHPLAPATAADGTGLDAVIAAQRERMLGSDVVRAFGGQLREVSLGGPDLHHDDHADDRRLTILTDDERAVVHYGGRPLVPGDEG